MGGATLLVRDILLQYIEKQKKQFCRCIRPCELGRCGGGGARDHSLGMGRQIFLVGLGPVPSRGFFFLSSLRTMKEKSREHMRR